MDGKLYFFSIFISLYYIIIFFIFYFYFLFFIFFGEKPIPALSVLNFKLQ